MLDIIWNAVEDEYLTVIMYLLCSIPMRFSRKTSQMIHNGGCCHWTWWIIRPVLSKPISGWTFVIEQSRQVISSRGQALSEFFCWHLHRHPRGMTLQPALASVALKRKPVAMGERAPRAPSIGVWSCRLPSLVSAFGSVALTVCHLVLEAAVAPLGVIGADAQTGSTLATIPDGLEAVEPGGKWPRCDEPALPLHDGRSDAPVR